MSTYPIDRAGFFGVEVGYLDSAEYGRPMVMPLGEVPRCRSRAEAEHLGRMMIGMTVSQVEAVAGFEATNGVDLPAGCTVHSFSVYFYNGEETTGQWDYTDEGRRVA